MMNTIARNTSENAPAPPTIFEDLGGRGDDTSINPPPAVSHIPAPTFAFPVDVKGKGGERKEEGVNELCQLKLKT